MGPHVCPHAGWIRYVFGRQRSRVEVIAVVHHCSGSPRLAPVCAVADAEVISRECLRLLQEEDFMSSECSGCGFLACCHFLKFSDCTFCIFGCSSVANTLAVVS